MRFAFTCQLNREDGEYTITASFIRPDDDPDNLVIAGVISANGIFPVTGEEIEMITEMARADKDAWQIVESASSGH